MHTACYCGSAGSDSSGGLDDHRRALSADESEDANLVCEDHGHHGLSVQQYNVEHALHIASLVILYIFAVHLLLEMVAFGKGFFRTWTYDVDVIIVAVALIFEQGQFAQEGALLTLLLLWRAIRVVHAVLSSIEIEHQLAEESLVEHEKEDLAQLLEQEKDDAKVIAREHERRLSRILSASTEEVRRMIKGGDAPDGPSLSATATAVAAFSVPDNVLEIQDVAKLQMMVAQERSLREKLLAGEIYSKRVVAKLEELKKKKKHGGHGGGHGGGHAAAGHTNAP